MQKGDAVDGTREQQQEWPELLGIHYPSGSALTPSAMVSVSTDNTLRVVVLLLHSIIREFDAEVTLDNHAMPPRGLASYSPKLTPQRRPELLDR